ncbi:Uncharacterised protein [Mycobacteroides abscessus subsp. abscessus]|nr:Uncharacterised protein [Mycobacteroides abscessus subsp. abscessus]
MAGRRSTPSATIPTSTSNDVMPDRRGKTASSLRELSTFADVLKICHDVDSVLAKAIRFPLVIDGSLPPKIPAW